MKKLMKGISKAIEIDSANEENIDKTTTINNSLFLFVSKYEMILFKS